MSEKNAVMSIEDVVKNTLNLSNTVVGLPAVFVGVANHLAVVGEVISRLKTENDMLHLKVHELQHQIASLDVPASIVPAEAYWPEISFGPMNDFVFGMIKNGVMAGYLSISGNGYHDEIADSRVTKTAPNWDVLSADDFATNAAGKYYRYGATKEKGNIDNTYFFGLTIKGVLASDLVIDCAINSTCLELVACISNEAGIAYTYTPLDAFAFANILKDVSEGNYSRVTTLINSVLPEKVSTELSLASSSVAEPTTPAEQQPEPAPAVFNEKAAQNEKYSNLMTALTGHYAKQFGRMRVFIDSITNTNANDPMPWDRDILLSGQTGCYNRGKGEVLMRYRLSDIDDLVVVSKFGDEENNIVVGFYKVDPASKVITPVAESVAKDLLKELLV